MKEIISRLTMKKNGESRVFKQYSEDVHIRHKLYTYVDIYGDKYQAFSPFYFWSWRREKTNL